jgi:hypothetical protein
MMLRAAGRRIVEMRRKRIAARAMIVKWMTTVAVGMAVAMATLVVWQGWAAEAPAGVPRLESTRS